MPSDQSKIFKKNFAVLRFQGAFPGETPSKYYKYYSFLYIFVNFVLYNILLTLNLIYTPWKIELLLREVIFNFTEITVGAQMLTVLLRRDMLFEALKIVDCDEFVGDYKIKNGNLRRVVTTYNLGWKVYMFCANVACSSLVLAPIFLDLIRGTKSELPICKYYFLSDEVRDNYFVYLFIYQSVGIHAHMMYNVNVDSIISGLFMIAIAQLRILNNNLSNLKLSDDERSLPEDIQDKIQISRLKVYLKHYELILKYCNVLQEMLRVTLFFQFGVASVIICVIMAGLLLPSTTEFMVFMVMYFSAMTFKVYVLGYLGTQLTYESHELMTAAYNSDWIPRSEKFKRNIKLFIERTKTPIMMSGFFFPLSLTTFTSIAKTAYSFFTLIRSFQD